MNPTYDSTKVSLEKVDELVQQLIDLPVDLKEEKVSKGRDESIDDLIQVFHQSHSHHNFVKGLDTYLHMGLVNEVVVKHIIETCPEFLATIDKDGMLPIHHASWVRVSLVPLLANHGLKYQVGGEDGRGGLTVNVKVGDTHFCLLTELANKTDELMASIFEDLRTQDPPLFKEEDVYEYGLLNEAINIIRFYEITNRPPPCFNIELVKLFVEMSPKSLFREDCLGRLPVFHACKFIKITTDYSPEAMCRMILELFVTKAIEYDPTHPSIGGLFRRTHPYTLKYETAAKQIIDGIGEDEMLQYFEEILSSFPELPLLHKLISLTSKNEDTIRNIIRRLVEADKSRLFDIDTDGCLPIHYINYSTFQLKFVHDLLHISITQNPSCKTFGGLFAKNNDGKTALEYMILSEDDENNVWECIRKLLKSFPDILKGILYQTLVLTPQYCSCMLTIIAETYGEDKMLERVDEALPSISDTFILHKLIKSTRECTNIFAKVITRLIKMDKSRLYTYDEENGFLPLDYLHKNENNDKNVKLWLGMVKLLLHEAITYDPQNDTIGGLFDADEYGSTPLDCLVGKFGKDEVWQCIQETISSFPSLPILHRVIKYTPEYINEAIMRFPGACFVRDCNNRLPSHVALENGVSWSLELLCLINTNMTRLKDNDPVTGLSPVVLAASKPSCDLTTIYYLLKSLPM